jgi:hypothetical protein
MIELLVVISIMAILSAMILMAIGKFSKNAEKSKTQTIIQTVQTGINLTIANVGSTISPTEHPLAGSRAYAGNSRFSFVRRENGSSVSGTGEALKGPSHYQHLSGASYQSKLMMSTDRYADNRVPILYGAMREDIGVFQSLRKVVTKYRLLPKPPVRKPDASRSIAAEWYPLVISPVTGTNTATYEEANYPNTLIPTQNQDENKDPRGQAITPAFGLLGDTKSALDYAFGNSNAQAELTRLKAIYNADPTLPDDVNTFKTGIERRTVGLDSEALVYTNYGSPGQSDSKTTKDKYEPGYLSVASPSGGNTSLDSGKWVKYRLAGMAIYDAWGNELMTVMGENNSYRVISAGADGVLAIDPGKNLAWDTPMSGNLDSINVQGDDKDGAEDNVK